MVARCSGLCLLVQRLSSVPLSLTHYSPWVGLDHHSKDLVQTVLFVWTALPPSPAPQTTHTHQLSKRTPINICSGFCLNITYPETPSLPGD